MAQRISIDVTPALVAEAKLKLGEFRAVLAHLLIVRRTPKIGPGAKL